ncbi:MAG: PIN domain-containing protein [Deltaproteobacteria bacterium]|nr:PIN domain-containing protein [Deltaproteobacteria bacterium]
MIAVDSNVLIAAHRSEHPQHSLSAAFLTEIAEGSIPWTLPVFCLGEFLRVVTHPRVLTPPSNQEVAVLFLDRLLASPTARFLVPGPRFWPLLKESSQAATATGNVLFGAQIAALCQEHGALDLVTFDRDFALFPRLSPRPPTVE